MVPKPIASPVPDSWYPALSVSMVAIGLVVTASFFINKDFESSLQIDSGVAFGLDELGRRPCPFSVP